MPSCPRISYRRPEKQEGQSVAFLDVSEIFGHYVDDCLEKGDHKVDYIVR